MFESDLAWDTQFRWLSSSHRLPFWEGGTLEKKQEFSRELSKFEAMAVRKMKDFLNVASDWR